MRTLFLAAALALATTAAGCSKKAPETTTEVNVPSVSIDELDASLAKAAAVPVDANGERTRKKMGVIPGAVLLTEDNWTISELPADKSKPLVFYCANTHCDASHEAAAKAMTAGYTNVKVLPDGIAGWVKAGKKAASI